MGMHIDEKEEMKRRIEKNKDDIARRNQQIQKERKKKSQGK